MEVLLGDDVPGQVLLGPQVKVQRPLRHARRLQDLDETGALEPGLISAAPRTICARVTAARCCCTMYRTFRALRGCRPVTFDRTGAACAKLPPGTGAPHRESPRPPAQPPIPAHTKNRPPCRFFGGLPPRSAPAPWRLGCVAIGGHGTARRSRRRPVPARSAPPPIHLRARADPPIGTAARGRTPTPTRNPTTSATAAHPPATPCPPIRPQHIALTRGTDRPVRPRTPAPTTGRCAPHAADLSAPGRVEFGRIGTRRVDRSAAESALPEPTPALECAIFSAPGTGMPPGATGFVLVRVPRSRGRYRDAPSMLVRR